MSIREVKTLQSSKKQFYLKSLKLSSSTFSVLLLLLLLHFQQKRMKEALEEELGRIKALARFLLSMLKRNLMYKKACGKWNLEVKIKVKLLKVGI